MKAEYSIIVPVYNGAHFLRSSLPAILSETKASQIIVVDDCSDDDSVKVARDHGVSVISLKERSGAAETRNRGASIATGEILVFVDADVVVGPGSISRIVGRLSASRACAVFGSYDDSPPAQDLVSQYLNLRHHYIHQISSGEAHTFWAGLGAIRREAFYDARGFNGAFPGTEDIALGYKLKSLGHSILLDPSIQGKHLKSWTLRSMICTDIFYRAVPWSRLRLSMSGSDSLNLALPEKIRALIALSIPATSLAVLLGATHWIALPALTGLAACANWRMGRFFLARRGGVFAAAALGLHQLYYIYAALSFIAVALGQMGQKTSETRPMSGKT